VRQRGTCVRPFPPQRTNDILEAVFAVRMHLIQERVSKSDRLSGLLDRGHVEQREHRSKDGRGSGSAAHGLSTTLSIDKDIVTLQEQQNSGTNEHV
jgi:hypothetical protein